MIERSRRGSFHLALVLLLSPGGASPSLASPQDPSAASEAPRADHAAHQNETMDIIRSLGAAWFDWLTDQMSSRSSGRGQYDFTGFADLAAEDLKRMLIPEYLGELRDKDGWGHPLEFRYSGDPTAAQVMLIRSPGRDGRFDDRDGVYESGRFPRDDYDQDIVWADGFFLRYPDPSKTQIP